MTGLVAPYRVSAIENTGNASTRGIAVNTANAANAKGTSWTQILAASAYDAEGIVVEIEEPNGNTHGMIDIAIGAGGSELVIIPNVLADPLKVNRYYFPLRVPAGSRLSAKAQSDFSGTKTFHVKLMLCSATRSNPESGGQIVDLGTSTASSMGTQIDPGGTANAKGAYAQLVAATAQEIKGLVIAVEREAVNPGGTQCDWFVDIAVGAGGSEQVVVPDMWCMGYEFYPLMGCTALYVPVGIPAGSRLAARCQCSSITAADRILRVAAYGVY